MQHSQSNIMDPFRHHPELRALVTEPLASFFRDFNAVKFIAETPEMHMMHAILMSDQERDESRALALADHGQQDLWIFAYGSLMWDPALQFTEVRRARIEGYSRHFILKDIYGARGTPEAPGLMAALDHGAECEGLIYRIAADQVDAETCILWHREMVGPAYKPVFVPAMTQGLTLRALTFVADHEAESIHTDMTRDQQVEYIATGAGFLGSSFDYLINIAQHFETLGIEDAEITALVEETARFRASL